MAINGMSAFKAPGWGRTETALYLERQYKRLKDRRHGGGDQPIPARVAIKGAMGKISGNIVGTA